MPNLEPRISPLAFHIYIDESIHTGPDFIVTAIVASKKSVQEDVSEALRKAGLRPGIDEYKSSHPKAGNVAAQQLRKSLINILFGRCYVALNICPVSEREAIGGQVAKLLADMSSLGRFENLPLKIVADTGIFSKLEMKRLAQDIGAVESSSIGDSRKDLGIQLADLCAHICATMLRCDLGILKKSSIATYDLTGYPDGTVVELEFELWAQLRGSLASQIQKAGSDEMSAEMQAFGLAISAGCSPEIKTAALQRFETVWVGCIH